MFEEKGKGTFWRTFLTSVFTSLGVGALLFATLAGYVGKNLPPESTGQNQQENTAPQTPQPQQIAVEVPSAEFTPATVARSATPGVVGISVLKVDGKSIFDNNAAEKWGVGSGVIMTPDGYIITNNHVAGGRNKRIVVSLADGRNVEGTTVWADPVIDLAIVKINEKGLTTIPIGDAKSLQVGEPAIAIGNPLGLQFQRTVTSGIISALNRTIKIDTEQGTNYMEDLIQTDASINPGNSGGPLLNSRGQVVGINTVKVTSAEAIGFAVPINVAVPIINQLENGGKFVEPYLGVFAYDREVIPYLDGDLKIDHGVYIVNVDEAGPAARVGIQVGCVIIQVDGKDVNTMMDLREYMYSKKPGDTIMVKRRTVKGEILDTPIKLMAKEKDGLITR